MVAGELLELAGAGEVDSGVADVGEVEVFGGEPGEGEGGGHAAGVIGGDACDVDLFVDGAEGEGEVAEAVREESSGGSFEGFRDDFRHPLEEEGGCEVAGVSAAHAIGDGEDEVVAGEVVGA